MKALIKGDYNYYRANDRHLIFPVFNVDGRIRQSPLLNLRILVLLQSVLQSGDTAEMKCMSISSILSYFDAMGHPDTAVEVALSKIFIERLVEPYDASDQSISPTVRLSITHRGIMHLELAVFNSVFFEQLALTTRITDPEVAREMRRTIFSPAPLAKQMGSLRAQFATFLIREDARFGTVPDASQFESQRHLTMDLQRYCNENFEQLPEMHSKERMQTKVSGLIDLFDRDKGYGFVALEGNDSRAFLHITALQSAGIEEIADGDIIVCDVGKGQKGISVMRVHSVQRPKASKDGFTEATIVKIPRDREYGFVYVPSLDIDAFFHFSVVDKAQRGGLREGATVRVEINRDPKGRGFQVRRLVL
jgi:cold shock CspA family protein